MSPPTCISSARDRLQWSVAATLSPGGRFHPGGTRRVERQQRSLRPRAGARRKPAPTRGARPGRRGTYHAVGAADVETDAHLAGHAHEIGEIRRHPTGLGRAGDWKDAPAGTGGLMIRTPRVPKPSPSSAWQEPASSKRSGRRLPAPDGHRRAPSCRIRNPLPVRPLPPAHRCEGATPIKRIRFTRAGFRLTVSWNDRGRY